MRYLVIILLFFFSFEGIAQPISYRSNNQITVFDYNLFTGSSFRVPVYKDTIAANAAYTLDSCGKIIFTYTGNILWYRACNPKRWLQVGSGSITRAVDTIYRTPGKDSIYYKISGITYRIKDSIGGGSSTPNLQQVTNIGDTTTNNIYVNKLGVYDGANDLYNWIEGGDQSISFYNGYDSTHMAQIQNGVIASFDTNNIQGSINFNGITAIREYKTPDTSGILTLSVNGKFADTKGNIDIDTAGTQNLQQVTDIGSTTTNTIDVYNGGVINVWNDTVGGVLSTGLFEDGTIYASGGLTLGDNGVNNYTSTLSALDSFTNYRNIYLPDTSGTIALSVNGYTANNKGQITIPVGTGTVTGTGTATRVAFWDGTSSLSSNANLYWDNSNSRLGISNTIPVAPIDLGSGTGTSGSINKIALYSSPTYGTYGFGISPAQLDYVSANNHVFYSNSPSTVELFKIGGTGTITATSLIGTGTRMVVADSVGTLSTQTIPTGTVTSISQGYGIANTPDPITTTGTIKVDTATLSTKYLRITDTTNKWVNNITRTLGKDSIIYYIGSTRYAIKDSVGTNPAPVGYYGAWQDDFTQTAAADNTGYAMKFHTADITPNGISIANNGSGDPTRITFANTGIYNLQFSSQFQNTDNAQHDITIWLRLNGSDVSGSSGFISIPARRSAGAGNEGHLVTSWNYVLSVVGGQYYELIWSTSNHTNVTMQYYAAGSPPPSTASAIMTITQQSGIMAGTGLTAINSLTGAVQTMVTGTDSTDFKIASTGTTHTFNLPTASATKRGALSSADWTTFNSKVGGSGTIGAIPKYTGTSTLGDATADVDYLQQDMSLIAMQSMGSSIKCYNIGAPIPTALSATSNMGTGSLYLVAVYIPKAVTITGVKWFQTINGANVANNYNGVALYSVSGGTLTLVDSSTRDGNVWKQGVDWQSKAFVTPYSASRGIYYVGALMSYSSTTTAPSLAYNGSTSATYSATSSFDFTNSQKIAGTLTSQTIVPSTITLSSLPSVAYKFGLYLY